MDKLILVSLLLAVVYNWEEFKRLLRVVAYRLVYGRVPPADAVGRFQPGQDQIVRLVVTVAVLPIGLLYLLNGPGELTGRLLAVLAQLALVVVVCLASDALALTSPLTKNYTAMDRILLLLVMVAIRFLPARGGIGRGSKILAKFSLTLAAIVAAGLILDRALIMNDAPQPVRESLIAAAVGLMFAYLLTGVLARVLHSSQLKFSGFLRVALGVLILTLGLTPVI